MGNAFSMKSISANVPMTTAPTWAVWQRQLLNTMNQSVQPFLDHFTRARKSTVIGLSNTPMPGLSEPGRTTDCCPTTSATLER